MRLSMVVPAMLLVASLGPHRDAPWLLDSEEQERYLPEPGRGRGESGELLSTLDYWAAKAEVGLSVEIAPGIETR